MTRVRNIADIPQLTSKPLLSLSLDSILSVGLMMAGFDLTGGYYSPDLDLGTKLGCGEAGHAHHLAIYWAAPCVGALLADPLNQARKQLVHNLIILLHPISTQLVSWNKCQLRKKRQMLFLTKSLPLSLPPLHSSCQYTLKFRKRNFEKCKKSCLCKMNRNKM